MMSFPCPLSNLARMDATYFREGMGRTERTHPPNECAHANTGMDLAG